MVDVSIVIPVAMYHKDLAARALASVQAQTEPCIPIVIQDTEGKGAGWARNQGLAQVQTPYVVFLDADDEITPIFVERCLAHIRPNHYVYTAWYQDLNVLPAPARPWQVDSREWHVLTTLIPTDAARRVGGFNETLLAAEDTYFYWSLTRSGVCGIPLQEPLFRYGREGLRSKILYTLNAAGTPEYTDYYHSIMTPLIERYGTVGCCDDENPIKSFVPAQPGDVQAQAMWQGNRRVLGVVSGRLYQRSSFPHTQSVDPRDVDARPDEWQRVRPPAPVPAPIAQNNVYTRVPADKVLDGVGELVRAYTGGKVAQPAAVLTANELQATLPTVKPDVSKIRALAGYKAAAQTIAAPPVDDVVTEPPKAKRGRKPKAK